MTDAHICEQWIRYSPSILISDAEKGIQWKQLAHCEAQDLCDLDNYGVRLLYEKVECPQLVLSLSETKSTSRIIQIQTITNLTNFLLYERAKPRKQHFLPLIQRIEKRLSCSSIFLSQAGRLVLVNSVFSVLPTFFMCTLKIPKTIIKQIDIFRKNCLCRGNDLSSKKPPLIAWASVTQIKVNGGLGVLRLETQNETLLIKFLHKFFNNNDLPWVNLVWNNYYSSRGLPGHRNIGSFWWKSMIKLLSNFKGLTHPIIGNGRSILFWDDQWSQNIPRQKFPELFSFVKNTKLSIKEAKDQDQFAGFFHLLISEQAYDQYLELQVVWEQIALSNVHDRWRYIWSSDNYSSQKAYRHFMGHPQVHPIYRHLWKSKCQPKHRVFYWLWLKNRLNTRDMLRRKNMTLESYSCENCLWQREKTLYHLFLRCNFAKAWNSIGIPPKNF